MDYLKELENEIDSYLKLPDKEDGTLDPIWHDGLKITIEELCHVSDATENTAIIRILAKSLVAYDKKTSQLVEMANFMRGLPDMYKDWAIKTVAKTTPKMLTQIKSDEARSAAIKRHNSTYELKAKIIDYWQANIGANVSNELAAERLQKQFPEVAHRTLTRYVSEAKKLQSASTL